MILDYSAFRSGKFDKSFAMVKGRVMFTRVVVRSEPGCGPSCEVCSLRYGYGHA